MKKYLLTAIVALFVGSTASAQDNQTSQKPNFATEQKQTQVGAATVGSKSNSKPETASEVGAEAGAGAGSEAGAGFRSDSVAVPDSGPKSESRFGQESKLGVAGKKKSSRVKINREIEQKIFIPKGTWFGGGTISYTDIGAGSYKFLLFDNLTTKSFLFGAKIFAGYTFANNVAAGVSFDYSRTLIKIDQVDINLGSDLNFAIKDFYSIQQVYTATAFLRTYINIGNSKRIGMFNDLRAYFGGGQGKITNGAGAQLAGTYEKILKMGLVLAPGISVFATDFMTVEATIGILGIEYSRVEQISNQVYQGSFETFNASFQLNLLSIGLGVAFYF